MKITGVITLALPETNGVSRSGKPWRKRSYVARYDNHNEQYPKEILFDILGDKIDKLNLQINMEYEMEIDFSVKEYQGHWFMSASCWKANSTGQTDAQAAPQQAYPPSPQTYTPQAPYGQQQPAYGYPPQASPQQPGSFPPQDSESDLPF